MDILLFGIFGGFILVCIYLQMILTKLERIYWKLDHIRNALWKQHTLETEEEKRQYAGMKRSIWGSADRKS